MKSTKIFIILILLFVADSFGQQKGIFLINKKDKDSVFISENHRIKITTTSGEKVVGVLKIIDDKTLVIDGQTFPVENIVKIRRASMFHAIVDPVCIVIGSLFIVGGIIAISYGGIGAFVGVIALFPGLPMVIIPVIKNNHKVPDWQYYIQN